MKLKKLDEDLTVCQVASVAEIDWTSEFFFVGKTDEEVSLVCRREDVPANTIRRQDGWRVVLLSGGVRRGHAPRVGVLWPPPSGPGDQIVQPADQNSAGHIHAGGIFHRKSP